MNTKRKGSIAELAVAAHLISKGWNVLFPYGEDARYDIVAEKDARFVRIQVKYTTPKNGTLNVNCRSSNNWSVLHYTHDIIDVLAAYNPVSQSIYFLDMKNIMTKSLFKIRIEKSRNNQRKGIHDCSELKLFVF